ncbi:transposase [Mycetohabitans sp. B5]|nr:transposase [Mycetohabitans sp. B5]
MGVRQRRDAEIVQPGKATQNAFIESFNGKFRDECVNEQWLTSPAHARAAHRGIALGLQQRRAAQRTELLFTSRVCDETSGSSGCSCRFS